MQNNTYVWYRSPAVWAMILMFITGGVQSLTPMLNPALSAAIMAVLGVAGAYFHVSGARAMGAVN